MISCEVLDHNPNTKEAKLNPTHFLREKFDGILLESPDGIVKEVIWS